MEDPKDQMRCILTYTTMALMVLTLVIFALTGNVAVLGTDTIIWFAVYAIFSYYFSGNDNK